MSFDSQNSYRKRPEQERMSLLDDDMDEQQNNGGKVRSGQVAPLDDKDEIGATQSIPTEPDV